MGAALWRARAISSRNSGISGKGQKLLLFLVKEKTHRKMRKTKPSHVLSVVPDDVVQDVVAEPPPYGTIEAVQELYDEAGFLGFWKGVLPTLIMVSNPSIQFMLYEAMLKRMKKRNSNAKGAEGLTAFQIFLLGAIAKLGATMVTYPINVVKARKILVAICY
ncbi:hypothetical protein HPP92_018608 [Vanilla planifolia]|uniref:Uncharacterized protein n=1 Tax=Vanilla planifolia TaxID=51239 RepID=A0A835QA41_VANPL|nr:hypothetical protein HPP92_018608 [Vanilla planifolia]